MKKLLAIMLTLVMVLGLAACGSPKETTAAPTEPPKTTEAPTTAAPTEAPTEPAPAEPAYTSLGLNIKNKTGAVINEVYIYEKGGEAGNSVVAAGWKDKDADKENYEKNIYIVREAGAEFELKVVFEDGSEAKKDLGKLEMYTKISMKDGTDPAAWEVELEDKAEDQAAMALAVAVGRTADGFYPGYELIPVELKNKTGKNIVDFRFYEEGGNKDAYNNIIDYLYGEDGNKMDSLMPGKAKEGGMYLFKCFVRPHADNYNVYVKFDDGSEMTYPIEDWFKPDGDGHLPNEISLKNAEDKYDIKVQYDDGDPEPLAYLAESLAKGWTTDLWYPVYDGVPEVDKAAFEEAKTELAKIIPGAEPAEPDSTEDPGEEVDTYVGYGLNIKNKTGKTINEVYIYPKGDDKGASVVEPGWKDKDEDKENYEKNIYIIRKDTAPFEVFVVFEDGEEATWELKDGLSFYDKLSMKKGTDVTQWEQEQEDDAEVLAALDALEEAGVTTDGWYPETVDLELHNLALNLKNKTGKTINEVYIYVGNEDEGKSVIEPGWKDKDADKDNYEKYIYIIRPDKTNMEVKVVFEDGEEVVWQVGILYNYEKLSMKGGTDPAAWEAEENDDAEDIAKMDALIEKGETADGWYPEF
ncbi:MAG: acid shock protein [Lachnospiraceae bacterium]|nr:acid shock protein [Lachnospiraceae bacterium]